MKNKLLYLVVVLFVFLGLKVFAQSAYQDRPLLTQQIDRGEVIVTAESTAALVPGMTSVVPLVSTATGSSDCAWYEVPCFKKEGGIYRCECHIGWCDSGWTEGPCPNP